MKQLMTITLIVVCALSFSCGAGAGRRGKASTNGTPEACVLAAAEDYFRRSNTNAVLIAPSFSGTMGDVIRIADAKEGKLTASILTKYSKLSITNEIASVLVSTLNTVRGSGPVDGTVEEVSLRKTEQGLWKVFNARRILISEYVDTNAPSSDVRLLPFRPSVTIKK